MDAIAEAFARFLIDFIVEMVVVPVGYWPGWLVLKVITLGKYPPPKPKAHNKYAVAAVPYIGLIIGCTVYYS
jgi:hypothetical protein